MASPASTGFAGAAVVENDATTGSDAAATRVGTAVAAMDAVIASDADAGMALVADVLSVAVTGSDADTGFAVVAVEPNDAVTARDASAVTAPPPAGANSSTIATSAGSVLPVRSAVHEYEPAEVICLVAIITRMLVVPSAPTSSICSDHPSLADAADTLHVGEVGNTRVQKIATRKLPAVHVIEGVVCDAATDRATWLLAPRYELAAPRTQMPAIVHRPAVPRSNACAVDPAVSLRTHVFACWLVDCVVSVHVVAVHPVAAAIVADVLDTPSSATPTSSA